MILSHYRAGTGALCVETREEARFLRELLAELPERTEVGTIAAPTGKLTDARTGAELKAPANLTGAYTWAQGAPGRVLVVYDWHMLANAPGHWRALIDALPGLRAPKGAGAADTASLAVFLAPHWELSPANPLRGLLPQLTFDLPTRESLRATAEGLSPLPTGTEGESIVDALCGLSADAAEQAAAEVLARPGGRGWDAPALQGARKQLLASGGLEIWEPVPALGGLAGLQTYADTEVVPWLRDPQLSVRRLLCAGLPGTGKSFCARWLGFRLNAPVARLSIPRLKAGIVGASEGNLRRALSTLDALGAHAPVVAVIDEIDTIAREGMDGGTSSGMFSELLTWLQESKAQALVIATLNRLDKLDAALESRFTARFFFDLPTAAERYAVAQIHLARLGSEDTAAAAGYVSAATAGFSSREIAEQLIPSVLRQTHRKPTRQAIKDCAAQITPSSQTQADQLAQMRRAASTLRRANDPEDQPTGKRGRQIASETIGPDASAN